MVSEGDKMGLLLTVRAFAPTLNEGEQKVAAYAPISAGDSLAEATRKVIQADQKALEDTLSTLAWPSDGRRRRSAGWSKSPARCMPIGANHRSRRCTKPRTNVSARVARHLPTVVVH